MPHRPPRMATTTRTQRLMMPTMLHRECAEATHCCELRLDFVPATREVAIVVPMWEVSNVMFLTDVDGSWVGFAVVLVVAERLHVVFRACFDHDLRVVTRGLSGGRWHEPILASWHTVAAAELG